MKYIAMIASVAMAGSAFGQSASVSLSAPTTSAAPGDTISISVDVSYDLAGAGAGVFGAAGFYGFGGDVNISGVSAPGATAASETLEAMLSTGPVIAAPTPPSIARAAAGRGLDGGLAANPISPLTFDLTVDAGAADGTITLDYTGAVVLVLDSTLATFSTSPGVNQSTLSTTPLIINVSSASCLCEFDGDDSDVAVTDLLSFLSLWFASDPGADVNGGGVDVTDLLEFLSCWFPASGGADCP